MTQLKRRRELKKLASSGDAKAMEKIAKDRLVNKNTKQRKRAEQKLLISKGDVTAIAVKQKEKLQNCLNKIVRQSMDGRCNFSCIETGSPPSAFGKVTIDLLIIRARDGDCENYSKALHDPLFGRYIHIGISMMDGEQALNRIIMSRMLIQEPTLCQAVPALPAHHSSNYFTTLHKYRTCEKYKNWRKIYSQLKVDAFLTEDNLYGDILANHSAFYACLNNRFSTMLTSAIDHFEGYDGKYRQMWLCAMQEGMPCPVFDMELGIFVSLFVYIHSHSVVTNNLINDSV